jgi:PAS domain S-box-containing protein
MENKPSYEDLEKKIRQLEDNSGKAGSHDAEAGHFIRFLTSVINSTDDPIFVKDENHKWVLLNDACCRQIGRDRDVLIGKTDFDFHPKAEAEEFWKGDALVLQTGQTNLNREHVTYPDGSVHVLSTKKSLLVDTETGKKYVVGMIRDITAQAALEAEREKLIVDLQDALLRIKTLKGLIPICAACKKVRSDNGYWQQVEVYVRDHSQADFTHGYCPECAAKIISES